MASYPAHTHSIVTNKCAAYPASILPNVAATGGAGKQRPNVLSKVVQLRTTSCRDGNSHHQEGSLWDNGTCFSETGEARCSKTSWSFSSAPEPRDKRITSAPASMKTSQHHSYPQNQTLRVARAWWKSKETTRIVTRGHVMQAQGTLWEKKCKSEKEPRALAFTIDFDSCCLSCSRAGETPM